MGGTGVIDHFLEVFTRYIDGGFGLLGGEGVERQHEPDGERGEQRPAHRLGARHTGETQQRGGGDREAGGTHVGQGQGRDAAQGRFHHAARGEGSTVHARAAVRYHEYK